jgi:hypothetical protein
MVNWHTDSLRSTWFYISLFLLVFFLIPFIPGHGLVWKILWSHGVSSVLGVYIVVSGVALFLAAGLLDGPARGGVVVGLGVIGLGLVIAIAALLASRFAHPTPLGRGPGLTVVLVIVQLLVLTLALSANNISIYFPDTGLAKRIAAGAAVVALTFLAIYAALTVRDLVIYFAAPSGSISTGRPVYTISVIIWILALGYSCILMITGPWRKGDTGFVAYRAQRVAVTSILVFSVWFIFYMAVDLSGHRGGNAYVAILSSFITVRYVGLLLALLFMVGGGLSDFFRNLLAPTPTLRDYRREHSPLTATPSRDALPPPPDRSDAATPSEGDASENE